MQVQHVSRASTPGAKALFGLQVLLLCISLLWSSMASAAPSITCPTVTATVPNGGTVVIDVSTCDDPDDFGLGATVTPPSHGSIVVSTVIPQTVTYSHNGDTATSDTFVVNDGQSPEGQITFLITITPPTSAIVVSPASLPAMTAGSAFSQTLTSTGGTAPYTYTLNAGTMPAGLSLTSGGVLSGTPTQRGAYSFDVRSQDSVGDSATKGYTGTVANPTLSISPTSATAIQGIAFSQTLTASGGVAPHTFLLETGTFPAGISISSSGAISGTTSAAPGAYPVTLRVTDSSTGPGSYFELESFTLTVSAPPSVSIAVAPATVSEDGATNLVYTVTRSLNLSSATVVNITTSGTAASGSDYTGGVATASIAAGATTATITINPTVDGTVEADETVVLTVAAGTGYTIGAPSSATGTILNDDVPVTISPASLPAATVGSAYSQTITASGGTAPYTFAVTAGALPAGLSLSSAGALTGTPTAGGTFNFTVTATDNASNTGSQAYSLTVNAPTISVAPSTLPGATVGAAYSQSITASGATAPYTFAVTAGALPAGLSLSSGGALSGTPTSGGTFNFTITATDSSTGTGPFTGSRAYTLTVNAPTISVAPASLPGATQGAAYSQTITASGATAPYTFAVTAGALPSGLSLSSGGVLSGTPSVSGTFNFTVTATDSSTGTGPFTGSRAYTLTVATAAPTANDVSATVAHNSGANPITLNITGGVPTSVAVATPPSNGTAIASGTSITYQPNAGYAGPDAFTYTASNVAGTSAPATVSITVSAPTIVLSPATLPDAAASNAYSQTLSASGGTAPYSFSLVAGGLPIGVGMSSAGVFSGTPVTAGAFNFTVRATDANGFTGDQAYTVVITAPTITVSPATLSGATAGVAYSQTFAASGGASPYAFSLVSGGLPIGMSMSSVGLFSGTPVAAGTFNFTVRATDANGFTGDRAYSLVVAAPTIVIAPASLPDGTVGVSYSQAITASGGTAPYTHALTAGALPPGLSFTSGGALSGTPTASGTFNFTVTATDSTSGTGPFTGNRSYSLIVNVQLPVANPVSVTVAYGSSTNPVTLNITDGTPTSVAVVTVPAHGTATASGTSITYTPDSGYAGPDSFTYNAANGSGTSTPATVSVSVNDPVVTITASGSLSATAGSPYSQTFTWNGGGQPWTGYQVTNLPAGLSITSTTANTATISGTPTQAGSFALNASATDSSTGNGPYTVGQVFTLTVAAPGLTMTPAAGTLTATYSAPYSQAFAASGGSGSFSYALTGTLPAGVTFSGNTLSGTPTVPGSYPIAVTATDTVLTGAGAPFSIAQNYTLDVPAPTIVVDPATLPNTTAGLAYSQTITATGGVGPYSFAVSAGALPDGLSLASGGALSGTTTTSGTFNFTVTTTDSFGQVGSNAYTVVVAVPTITLTPATLPAGSVGTAYTQVLTITGGIAPYTVNQTGALPTGITFDAAARTFSGTPTQSGTFNIAVTATDSTAGTAATVTNNYTLTIAAPTLALSPASLPGGSAGIAYSQTFVASGGVAPYTYAVSAGALPAGVTLSASTGALAGTPTVAGAFNLSITATDSTTGTPGTVTNTYTLTVSAPSITVNPPVLPNGVVGVPYTHVLTAVGGTAPHTFAITAGALPGDLTLASDGRLTGEPVAGTFGFTVTATDALGFTGTRVYSIQVVQRPDPSRDPEVRGLLEAQSDSARRFASAQVGNFQQRLENLHDNREGARLSNRLSFAVSQSCVDYMGRMPGDPCNNLVASNGAVASTSASSAPRAADSVGETQGSANSPFSAWIGGVIRSGNQDGRGGGAGADFETDGVSIGADYRFSPAFALGAGLGYGRDESDVGDNGSRVEGDAFAMVLYASYHPGDRYFLDALAGYQRLSYDLRRYVTATGGLVEGSRDGRQWFGSVSAGAQFQHDTWQLTPYARVDISKATLDAYVEQGDPIYDLAYGEQDVDATTGNIGLRFESRHATAWGAFAPQVRIEYQHDFSGDSSATMQYADLLTGPIYRADLEGFDRNRFMVGLGGMFYLPRDFSLRAEYRGLFGNGGDRDNGLMLNIEKSY